MHHVPPPHRPRLTGLDAARGLAVLGMFAAHVGAPDTPFDWTDPSSWPDLVNGRSSILFALCAGVSLVLLTTGPGPTGRVRDRRHVLARAAVLLAIGALLTLVPGGVLVILPTYAVLFVAALPFLRLRLRWVVLAGALSLGAGPVLALVGQAVVELSGSGVADLVFVGYPAVSWFGVVLAGVLVARLGLERARVLRRTLVSGVAMAVTGYGGGALLGSAFGVTGPVGMLAPVEPGGAAGPVSKTVPSGGADVVQLRPEFPPFPQIQWERLLDITPHAGSSFELVGALGVALTVLATLSLVAARTSAIFLPLRAVGRLALTLYSCHVLAIGAWFASGNPDPVPALDGWFPFLALAVVAIVTALVVDLSGRRGPLEALTRRVSRALDDPRPPTA
ncbi:heparan-alpha-glucosaminide N-acetyltransferase domain-containing protein [Curtobacterium albidum]|uniref:heparan-alpha-glucosaminide N-acetyltransferase domain-containing protein n=1 Tax=Curtobacterium citreum TaxID=2036 RepID=UPI00202720FF|nr:heparan-alpha-glucosaminide N-acetyltransferase domain-containing protein [Curtobacterium albidum]MCL9664355.1 heparan-alpha-glucosaminide N-acetyltransferase domain-containing protein [Curtobacterium albidum]